MVWRSRRKGHVGDERGGRQNHRPSEAGRWGGGRNFRCSGSSTEAQGSGGVVETRAALQWQGSDRVGAGRSIAKSLDSAEWRTRQRKGRRKHPPQANV